MHNENNYILLQNYDAIQREIAIEMIWKMETSRNVPQKNGAYTQASKISKNWWKVERIIIDVDE